MTRYNPPNRATGSAWRFLVLTRLAVAAVLAPGNLIAQEATPPSTQQQVLEGLRGGHRWAGRDAVAILTQQHRRKPRAQLDAFADSLAALAIAGDKDDRPAGWLATLALISSASPEEPGAVPYAGAYDALHKVFRRTRSYVALINMLEIDPQRGKELVRVFLAHYGDDACMADSAVRSARNGGEIARELGVELEPDYYAHYCPEKYHGYRQMVFAHPRPEDVLTSRPGHIVLAQLREGEAQGTEFAIAILTGVAELDDPASYDSFADSLVETAISGAGPWGGAHHALAVLKRSARPLHADANPYPGAYDAVARVFAATRSQAAFESLVEIDAARAHAFLAELAPLDRALEIAPPGNSTALDTVPPPTPQQVWERLGEGNVEAATDAVAILTQPHKRIPRSELEAFADSLVALAFGGQYHQALLARRALISSSRPERLGAVPYPEAYDALRKVFGVTRYASVLGAMVEIDPRRGKEVVRELFSEHGDDACLADMALRNARNRDAVSAAFGVELGPYYPGYCVDKYYGYQYLDVLAQLREEEVESVERAVDVLTERASVYPVYTPVLADSLRAMAASDGGTSDVARRALAVLERSARPVHPDATPLADAYDRVARVFQVTKSQAALESLVEIDPALAHMFLTELAHRHNAVACTARAVLEGTADSARLLRDLEQRGELTYRCP